MNSFIERRKLRESTSREEAGRSIDPTERHQCECGNWHWRKRKAEDDEHGSQMKITIEPTDKIVTLVTDKGEVPARIWEGVTESGTKCDLYVTRVAVNENETPERMKEFDRALTEQRSPRPELQAIPARLIL